MPDPEVNIPLLRKAVEWAEAEAAKPRELCEWYQPAFSRPANDGWGFSDSLGVHYRKSTDCGTCYCIAGWIAAGVNRPGGESSVAADALGISTDVAWELFDSSNTIEDVRRIAEDIAGERL